MKPAILAVSAFMLASAASMAVCTASSAVALCDSGRRNFQTCFIATSSNLDGQVEVVRVFNKRLDSPKLGDRFPAEFFMNTSFNDASVTADIVMSGDDFFTCGANADGGNSQIPTPIDLNDFWPRLVLELEDGRNITLPEHPTIIDTVLVDALMANDFEQCITLIDPRELPLEGCPDETGFFDVPGCSSTQGSSDPSLLCAAFVLLFLRSRRGSQQKKVAT